MLGTTLAHASATTLHEFRVTMHMQALAAELERERGLRKQSGEEDSAEIERLGNQIKQLVVDQKRRVDQNLQEQVLHHFSPLLTHRRMSGRSLRFPPP
jgi:hypothetical protein